MAATRTRTKKSAKPQNGVFTSIDKSDVLTLSEAAAYLRVGEADVIDAVNAHGLPGRQIGGAWRFLKSSVQDWLKKPARNIGNEAFLGLAGAWKDDPYIDEMLEEIYKQRGRPMVEDKE
jgi:excisionase family DNA binding protein